MGERMTFDKLPEAIDLLLEKVSRIEVLLAESGIVDSEELFNVAEAARFLDLAIATVYSKVCRKEIPVNKRGKRIYFYKTELNEWIRTGRKRTVTEIRESIQFTNKSRRIS